LVKVGLRDAELARAGIREFQRLLDASFRGHDDTAGRGIL
jgi:hypothetical protein